MAREDFMVVIIHEMVPTIKLGVGAYTERDNRNEGMEVATNRQRQSGQLISRGAA